MGKVRAKKANRVGVVICECDGEINRLVDVPRLVRNLKKNNIVAFASAEKHACSQAGLERIKRLTTIKKCSRLVIASCSERLVGELFRKGLKGEMAEPLLVEVVDLLEIAQLMKRRPKNDLTQNALRHIEAAVAKASLARPIERLKAPITSHCLVIGGGVAGLAAAGAISSSGIRVTLVEKESSLGGLVRRLNAVFPSYLSANEFIENRLGELEGCEVEILTGTEITGVHGYVGSFEVSLSNGKKINVGAIVVATGGDLLTPHGLFDYDKRQDVITQIELEELLLSGKNPGKNIVMIQCVGSRNKERPYCSRICCTASIKNTIVIKQRHPEARLTILSRGFAEYAGDLDKARQMGVEIIRYSLERPPRIGDRVVEVYDEISEMEVRIPFDLVVLAVPIVPSSSSEKIAQMLRLPTDEYGFIIEPSPKLRPDEFVPRGIFVAGCAHWPSTITESIVQGYSAGMRAVQLISKGELERSAFTVELKDDYCRGCGRCAEVCTHGAIEIIDGEDGLKKSQLYEIQCAGCGACVSVCPSGALSLKHLTREEISAAIEEATKA